MTLANSAKNALKKKLGTKRLFYVCRDIERAEASLLLGLNNFYIISNDSYYGRQLSKKNHHIILIKEKRILDTRELLTSAAAKKIIRRFDNIMVFKPTAQIEETCRERGWKLLNPPAALAGQVEEKISQVKWLGKLKKYLPLEKIDILKSIKWKSRKFILQFNRAHTGSGTILIDSRVKLDKLKQQFPSREARVSRFVDGPCFTVNCLVWGKRVLAGNISYQITGLKPFTDNPFATIGNDWTLPKTLLSKKQITEIKKIADEVGKKLRADDWQGLFGIDISLDSRTGRVYLIEINARQPASTSFESILQNDVHTKNGATIMEAHLMALLNCPPKKFQLIKISNGAQLVQRVTAATPHLTEPYLYKPTKFKHIRYENIKPDSDLMRVQTRFGIMESHNNLNEHGNELSIFIRSGKTKRIFNGPRAGMIIIKNGRLLCIERDRFGYHYFTLPGGTLENREKEQETARREILEETGLKIGIDVTKTPIVVEGSRHETYFWAEKAKGRVRLGGPERERNTNGNHYSLKWIKISDIKKINLLPSELKKGLIKIFRKYAFA